MPSSAKRQTISQARTAAKLANYFAEQTGIKPPVLDGNKLKATDTHQTLILIDGSEEQALLSRISLSAEAPKGRADAYALKVVRQGPHWIVAAAGRSPAGASMRYIASWRRWR